MARRWCDDLLIHSLEGCVEQGFLSRLRRFDWDRTEPAPSNASSVRALRRAFKAILWVSAHSWPLLAAAAAALGVLSRRR